MTEIQVRISEIFLTRYGNGARVACATPLRPAPGQYLLAYSHAFSQILPTPLFVQGVEDHLLIIPPPIPAEWVPGMELSLRGPLGNGFHLQASVHHLALVDLIHHGERLLPLTSHPNGRSAATVLLTDSPPEELPLEIETLPLSAFAEVLEWADFTAVECTLNQVKVLRDLAGINTSRDFPATIEALIDTPLICGGIAGCGVCSVRLENRWALACKDGPVFLLNQLSEEE